MISAMLLGLQYGLGLQLGYDLVIWEVLVSVPSVFKKVSKYIGHTVANFFQGSIFCSYCGAQISGSACDAFGGKISVYVGPRKGLLRTDQNVRKRFQVAVCREDTIPSNH